MDINSLNKSQFKVYEGESEMGDEDLHLIKKAREASQSAYSPYSNFQVGAAILLDSEEILLGSNQENSSYPAGLCAERVVLFNFGANYGNKTIKKLAVTAKKKTNDIFVPVTPCGGCRQVILEYELKQNAPIEILMQVSVDKWIKAHSAEVLLPFCFNKNSL